MRKWARSENLRSVPELVFADGDLGKGQLIARLKEDGFVDPIFRPAIDTWKDGMLVKGVLPLQAADLFAYEMFDPMRKIEKDGYIERIKRTYAEIDRVVPGEPGYYSNFNLSELSARLSEIKNNENA